jgi:hypothetical protein
MKKLLNIIVFISINSSLLGMKRVGFHDNNGGGIKRMRSENSESEIASLSPEHIRLIAYNSLILNLIKYDDQKRIKEFESVKNKFIYQENDENLTDVDRENLKILKTYRDKLFMQQRIPPITLSDGTVIIG